MKHLHVNSTNETILSPNVRTTGLQSNSAWQRVGLIGIGILYLAALLVNYYWYVSPVYSYAGMIVQDLPQWVWASAICLAVMPLLWMPIRCRLPSDYAVWILYITIIGPFPFIAVLTTRNYSFANALFIAFILVIAFSFFDCCRRFIYIPPINFPEFKGLFLFGLPIITLLISFFILMINEFQIDFSSDIYERRFHARELVVSGSLISYSIAFLRGTCVPLTITIGLHYRKHFFLILSLLATVIIFGFDGTKSSVFLPILITFVIRLLSKFEDNHGRVLLFGLIILVTLGTLESIVLPNSLISYVFIRRILFLPSLLTTFYWDFFSTNPYVLFSDNLLSGFIHARYDLPIPRIIGEVYFRGVETNANANLWASAYAQAGYIGVIFTSFFGGIILRFVDAIANADRIVPACVVCVSIGFFWSQGALHTSLLSNGIFACIMALLVFPTSAFTSNNLPVQKQNIALFDDKRPNFRYILSR
jgi:hypothetical protein